MQFMQVCISKLLLKHMFSFLSLYKVGSSQQIIKEMNLGQICCFIYIKRMTVYSVWLTIMSAKIKKKLYISTQHVDQINLVYN